MLGQSQKVVASDMRTAYSFAIGSNGEPDVKLSDSEKKDRGAFILWATQMLKDTNRAQDEGYIQKLADKWVLDGERKRAFTPGYGRDLSFGEAIRTGKADAWLPDMPDDAMTGQIKIIFKQHPEVHKKWLEVYNKDEDLAIRGYYKELILQDIGPRKR